MVCYRCVVDLLYTVQFMVQAHQKYKHRLSLLQRAALCLLALVSAIVAWL